MPPLKTVKTRTAIVALVGITTLTCLNAQRRTDRQMSRAAIEVAGANLRLGMTKAEVAERLVGSEITKLNENEWMLGSLEKGHNIGPTLQFSHGVLSYAERFWTIGDTDIVDQLFGVVSALNNEGFSQCNVTADTHDSPDIRAKRVWIICGEKSVLVIQRAFAGHSYDAVYERLGKMRETP